MIDGCVKVDDCSYSSTFQGACRSIQKKRSKFHCFLLLDDPIKNENKDFFEFLFIFNGFSTQLLNTNLKASTFCSAKILSQNDSKFANHILEGVRRALFFTLNTIILQFM